MQAQVIRGKVVEFRSHLPVHRTLVTLLDSKKDEAGVETRAESLGRFAILAPMVGRYTPRSRRLGYEEFYRCDRFDGARLRI